MKVSIEWVMVGFAVGLFLGYMLARPLVETYRRWYLLCRNAVERLDPNDPVLTRIGPRTSKREKWEGNDGR